MVEVFLKEIGDTCEHSAYCMKPECNFNGNSHCMIDISTAVNCAIAHCKRVIEVLEKSKPLSVYELNNHRLILSELEGRVK